MAKLVRPTDAYIEADVEHSGPGIRAEDQNDTTRFYFDGEYITLPMFGTHPRGESYRIKPSELQSVVNRFYESRHEERERKDFEA